VGVTPVRVRRQGDTRYCSTDSTQSGEKGGGGKLICEGGSAQKGATRGGGRFVRRAVPKGGQGGGGPE
jgi:hypothetical protein